MKRLTGTLAALAIMIGAYVPAKAGSAGALRRDDSQIWEFVDRLIEEENVYNRL